MEHNKLNSDEIRLRRYCFLARIGLKAHEIDEMDDEDVSKMMAMVDFMEERQNKLLAIEIAKIIGKMFGG